MIMKILLFCLIVFALMTCTPTDLHPHGCGVFNNRMNYKTLTGKCFYYEKGKSGKKVFIDKKICDC